MTKLIDMIHYILKIESCLIKDIWLTTMVVTSRVWTADPSGKPGLTSVFGGFRIAWSVVYLVVWSERILSFRSLFVFLVMYICTCCLIVFDIQFSYLPFKHWMHIHCTLKFTPIKLLCQLSWCVVKSCLNGNHTRY